MKKIALSFLTLMLALGLCVGCMTMPGGSSSEGTPTESSEEASSSAQGRPSKNSSDDGSKESVESADQDPYASDIY